MILFSYPRVVVNWVRLCLLSFNLPLYKPLAATSMLSLAAACNKSMQNWSPQARRQRGRLCWTNWNGCLAAELFNKCMFWLRGDSEPVPAVSLLNGQTASLVRWSGLVLLFICWILVSSFYPSACLQSKWSVADIRITVIALQEENLGNLCYRAMSACFIVYIQHSTLAYI